MAMCPYNKYLVVKHVSLFRECKCMYNKLIMIGKISLFSFLTLYFLLLVIYFPSKIGMYADDHQFYEINKDINTIQTKLQDTALS